MQENSITKYESDCIRFYMGDPEIVESGWFYGGPKAYNTINALLHQKALDEMEKISEGKTIEIRDADHLKQYISLILSIASAMKKYKDEIPQSPSVTYRIDRMPAIERIRKEKKIEGFYSTCKWGYLEDYAHTKRDVILLEIHRAKEVPYLDFEILYQNCYAKPEEAEILLPFHGIINRVEEVPLTKEELCRFTDMDGKAPAGKYRLYMEAPDWSCGTNSKNDVEEESGFQEAISKEMTSEEMTSEEKTSEEMTSKEMTSEEMAFEELISKELTSEETVRRVRRCIDVLMKKESLSAEDASFYDSWKLQLNDYICTQCSLL